MGTAQLRAEKRAAYQQPLRSEVVTYVLGTFCYLCVRAGHGPDTGFIGAAGGN
jgi:hypothetical protein